MNTPEHADGSQAWVRAERFLDASPDRAHRAWSDPEELASWFPRSVVGSLLPGARSDLVWSDRRVAIDVLESDPPSRFRFSWTPIAGVSATTVVTVTIEAYGYGSRVTLEDGPFDLAVAGAAGAYGRIAELWGSALANLRARIDFGADLRRPVR
jgi:uncharacterized protein YndB with AHSA1/START domain